MSGYAIKLSAFGGHDIQRDTPELGCVKPDKLATFTDLAGRTIRCTSGHLWVTHQHDVMDRVIKFDQRFTIPAKGKVIIGGKGCYVIEPVSR